MERRGLIQLRTAIIPLALMLTQFSGCEIRPVRGPTSHSKQSTEASLGRYQFASRGEIATFNAKVTGWLLKRGFSENKTDTFAAISGGKEWKMPGSLFSKRDALNSAVHVFIPESYEPKSNLQIIEGYFEAEGTLEEANHAHRDFDGLRKEFSSQFPDTYVQPVEKSVHSEKSDK